MHDRLSRFPVDGRYLNVDRRKEGPFFNLRVGRKHRCCNTVCTDPSLDDRNTVSILFKHLHFDGQSIWIARQSIESASTSVPTMHQKLSPSPPVAEQRTFLHMRLLPLHPHSSLSPREPSLRSLRLSSCVFGISDTLSNLNPNRCRYDHFLTHVGDSDFGKCICSNHVLHVGSPVLLAGFQLSIAWEKHRVRGEPAVVLCSHAFYHFSASQTPF